MDYWGVKYISVYKACDKLGDRGHSWEILMLDLLLDTIWWYLGLFSYEHKIDCVIKAFIKA